MTGLIDWLPLINILGFLGLGSAYIFIQWKTGYNQASAEVINAYKEQVALARAEISKLQKDLGILQGQLGERNKRIEVLEQVAQNRNPEMEDFIKTAGVAAKTSMEYMKNSAETLAEIKTFMQILHNDIEERKNAS